MQLEENQYHRSRGMPRPYPYAGGNTAKGFNIKFHGISERKKQFDDIREVSKIEIHISKSGILVQRISHCSKKSVDFLEIYS